MRRHRKATVTCSFAEEFIYDIAVKELSLNILDIVQNSIAAEADLIEITVTESEEALILSVKDNGYGMSEEILAAVQSPFFTTRTTRRVGMGIPLLKLEAEQTGGGIDIVSRQRNVCPDCCGTEIVARFNINHIDFTPLGDMIATIVTLMQGAPEVDYVFTHIKHDRSIVLDTRDMRLILGEDANLSDPMVLQWVKGMLMEQYA